jgi:hypothetical protein
MGKLLTIGCKLPHGVVLEIGLDADGRRVPGYRRVKLNGALHSSARDAGGFGLTEVMDDFWDAWKKKNSGLAFMNPSVGMITEHASRESAIAACRERTAVVTRLEALDPNKPPKGITVEMAQQVGA